MPPFTVFLADMVRRVYTAITTPSPAAQFHGDTYNGPMNGGNNGGRNNHNVIYSGHEESWDTKLQRIKQTVRTMDEVQHLDAKRAILEANRHVKKIKKLLNDLGPLMDGREVEFKNKKSREDSDDDDDDDDDDAY